VPLGGLQEISTGIDKSSSGATGWVGWAMVHPKIWRIFFTLGLQVSRAMVRPSKGSKQLSIKIHDQGPGSTGAGVASRPESRGSIECTALGLPTIRCRHELPPAGVSSLLCAPGALLPPPSVFSPSRTALVTSAPPSAPHSRTVWWRLRVSLTTSSSTWPPRLAECWRATLTGFDVTTTPMVP
jgi:hypothetical protein